MQSLRRKWELVLLAAVIALAAFFRFYQITETPPGLYPDEAANGNNALEALATGHFKIFYPENNGREGLFINLQAIALAGLGAEPWVLRVVSAVFGTLTVLGIYLLAKELFRRENFKLSIINYQSNSNASNASNGKRFENWKLRIENSELVALLSAFFLATSYWHINFSRIGFRAIMVPFSAVFAMYWLLKALRTGKISSAVLGGLAAGLGFHTYIAFRFIPFVMLIPILFAFRRWRQEIQNSKFKIQNDNAKSKNGIPCIPCVVALFLFTAFVVALPIGLYFLQHPADFFGRGGQVSIFSAESPLKEFAKSTILTLGMFNVWGDCNARHNLNCAPQLFWPVGILFLIGLILTIRAAFLGAQKSEILSTKPQTNHKSQITNHKRFWNLNFGNWNLFGVWSLEFGISRSAALLLFIWFIALMLPATLTREGLPHALRAIGLIPPVMILAGLGGAWLWSKTRQYVIRARENPHYAPYRRQLGRIHIELVILALALLAVIAGAAYRTYFIRFAGSAATYNAFAVDLWHQGQYAARLPDDIQKFIIVNLSGDDIRGVPAPAQTIMFATGTFGEAERARRRIRYVRRLEDIALDGAGRVAIIPMNGLEPGLVNRIRERFPLLEAKVPGDFMVFKN